MSRRHAWFGVQAAVTVLLLVLLFRNFDWPLFFGVLGQLPPLFYAGAFAAVVVGQVLYAWRWRVVLGGVGVAVSFGEVLRQYLIGIFFSNVMPTAVGGDAAKVYLLGRHAGYVPIGASVFLDRVLGFLWLSVLGAALAWVVPASAPVFQLNRTLVTLFAVGFVGAMVASRLPVERLLTGLVPGGWRSVAEHATQFVGLVRHGATRPATLATAAAVVAAYMWLLAQVYRAYFVANGLPDAGLLPVMLVTVSVAIFVNVPVSVNGIGLREQLHVLLLSALGIPKEAAVGISLVLFSFSLLLSLVGFAMWWTLRPAPAQVAA